MAVLSPQSLVFSGPPSLHPFPSPPPPPHTLLSISPVSRFFSRGRVAARRRSGAASAPLVARAASSSTASGFDAGVIESLGDASVFSSLTAEPVLLRDLWDQNEVAYSYTVWQLLHSSGTSDAFAGKIALVDLYSKSSKRSLLISITISANWELASVLRDSKSRFDSAGVKLIAIGVGTPDKARILAERLPFPLECLYADPDRKAYDILGLYYGLSRTFFNPASAKVFSRFDSIRNSMKNYTIEATPDDKASVLQQGGMFVFKGKQLLYARKDEGTGDHAPLDKIFDICCKAPVT